MKSAAAGREQNRNFKEKNMKNLMTKFVITLAILTLGSISVSAQDGDTRQRRRGHRRE
jgi:hypothetical protein